jgi:hypothetical protein
LDLSFTSVGAAGACLLFPAVTHLTAMTELKLGGAGLESSGASHLCSALAHLTALTHLDLSYNKLIADDGARIWGAAAAAGMTQLKTLELGGNGFSVSDVVGCEAWGWRQLKLPPPPDYFVAIADFAVLTQYMMSSDRAGFAATYHPELPLQLLQRIETSDPALTKLEITGRRNFNEAGCRVLARAMSQNTCITSLDLSVTSVGAAGACLLFPAVTHLTAMTELKLYDAGLESSGASHLCSALAHLTALTHLDLGLNKLSADDGARICGAAAAAGMTRLKTLELCKNGFSVSDVVGCEAWRHLNLPHPPDEIFRVCTPGFGKKSQLQISPLLLYLLSDDKICCHAIRIFVVGESTVLLLSADFLIYHHAFVYAYCICHLCLHLVSLLLFSRVCMVMCMCYSLCLTYDAGGQDVAGPGAHVALIQMRFHRTRRQDRRHRSSRNAVVVGCLSPTIIFYIKRLRSSCCSSWERCAC